MITRPRALTLVSLSFLSIFLCLLGNQALAAGDYPAKPIVVVVPQEPGADGDIMMRPVCQKVSEILGKPLVFVHKPGGGNTIGFREVHNAKPDGYTIGLLITAIAYCKLRGLTNFDYRDFTPICLSHIGFPILYSAAKGKRGFKTVQEVIAFAKAHPKEAYMATTTVGGAYWVAANAFQEAIGANFTFVPQEGGGGLVVTQTAGGHTDLGISGFSSAKAQIEAGNLRFLAVLGEKRLAGTYSNVPTLKELGYDVALGTFTGVGAPPRMPKPVTEKLVKAFEQASKDPEIVKHISDRYSEPYYLAPGPFHQFLEKQTETYRSVLGRAGLLKAN